MRRTALYSRSTRPAPGAGAGTTQASSAPPATSGKPAASADGSSADESVAPKPPRRTRVGALAQRHERWLALVAGLMIAFLATTWWITSRPGPRPLTQKDIDGAVLHTLTTQTLPSRAAKAYEAVRPSIVRVIGTGYPEEKESPKAGKAPDGKSGKGGNGDKAAKDGKSAVPDNKRAEAKPASPAPGKDAGKSGNPAAPKAGDPSKPAIPDGHPDIGKGMGVGTGVVIVDKGIILTNLHVVAGASKLTVIFHDGTESEATIIGVQPEHDLAVIRAHKIPDDLQAAVMRSTAALVPGDEVVAAGFPFGIGPSASSGIISGLKREYRSPEGKRLLTNLIQFDAAANPGNSGGPLVTMDGEVVGIVTAILNPTEQRVFVGIGFAVPIENAAAAAGMSPF